jgi:glycosyltransferase involved in cell wall biosynthesis
MEYPKITIGIPIYHQSGYLNDSIESALNQTALCEVIVCADGDQEAYEIAKKYPIKVINQVNKGLASARNSIIMNMTGDFFLPLDADDILLDKCVERIVQIAKETNADIIAPSFKEFGISNREVILGNPTLEDFKTANRIGYCSAIKKSVLLEVGGYNPKMVWGAEDYDLWFDLLKREKKLVTIPEVLWLYRTKQSSMWTETAKHADEFMNQIKINHLEVFNENIG